MRAHPPCDTAGARFLPLHAAHAIRYGMDPQAALHALTLGPDRHRRGGGWGYLHELNQQAANVVGTATLADLIQSERAAQEAREQEEQEEQEETEADAQQAGGTRTGDTQAGAADAGAGDASDNASDHVGLSLRRPPCFSSKAG